MAGPKLIGNGDRGRPIPEAAPGLFAFAFVVFVLAAAMLAVFSLGITAARAESAIAQAPIQWDESGEEVDVALVLAVDISFSMDLDEQRLQREGYIEALTSKQVLDAIRNGLVGRIAVTYLEWAGITTQYVIADWQIIEDAKSAEAFVAQLRDTPIRRARRTSVTGAIEFALDRLQRAKLRPIRRVIDVSGDGPNNDGGPILAARARALAAGITINGLPIVLNRPFNSSFDIDNLDEYYEDCVIGGPGSFMLAIRERDQFASAIRAKILREVAQASQNDAGPRRALGRTDCLIGERLWQRNWERN